MSLRLPPEEYKALCRRVLDRDGWRCRNKACGMRNSLHVHHVIYRSQGGVDESWNLITICNECHDLVHACKMYISVVGDNFVGVGGGADGEVRFDWDDLENS